jgi:hypothetical protein
MKVNRASEYCFPQNEQWDGNNDDVCFVLDQQDEFDIYSASSLK